VALNNNNNNNTSLLTVNKIELSYTSSKIQIKTEEPDSLTFSFNHKEAEDLVPSNFIIGIYIIIHGYK
jgi:hypothetical protein